MSGLEGWRGADEVSGWVLAGGQSSRMGRDKAMLKWNGTPLVQHALGKLGALATSGCGCRPRIVGRRPDLAAYAPVVEDLRPGCGPLGGIEAALTVSTSELNIFLPVDLPLIPIAFLEWMLARAALTGALTTIPTLGGRPQPLCSVLRRALLPAISRALDAGNFKVMDALTDASGGGPGMADTFSVEAIAPLQHSWAAEPRVHVWFRNLNRPEDLDAANLLMLVDVAGRGTSKVS